MNKKPFSFPKLNQLSLDQIQNQEALNAKVERMTPDEKLFYASQILEKPYETRKQSDVYLLKLLTSNIKFFKENEGNHLMCCKYMYLQKFPKDCMIFAMGSKGTTFYVILKEGSVGVIIMRPNTQLEEVAILKAGDYFGELALLKENGVRSASIKTKTDCVLACLEKEYYEQILMAKHAEEVRENILIFLQIPYFQQLGERDLVKIMYHRKPIKFCCHQTVFNQGESSEQGVYLIKSGLFKVTGNILVENFEEKQSDLYDQLKNPQFWEKKDKFKHVELAILQTGLSFGEEETFFNTDRQNTVVCISQEGELYNIPKEELKSRVFWNVNIVQALKEHIAIRSKIRKKIIQVHFDLMNQQKQKNEELKTNEFLQTLKSDDSQKELKKKKIFSESNSEQFPIKIASKKIYLLEDNDQSISSKLPKYNCFQKEFMLAELKNSFRKKQFSQPDLKKAINLKSSDSSPSRKRKFIQSFENRTQGFTPNENKWLSQPKISKNIKFKTRTQKGMASLINELVQRMKDKINGRITRRNDFLDRELNLKEFKIYHTPKANQYSESFYQIQKRKTSQNTIFGVSFIKQRKEFKKNNDG